MSMNLLTKGTGLVGDILLTQGDGSTATRKIIKEHVLRLGTGGFLITTSSENATAFQLPAQAVLYDAYLNVLTPSTGTTKTLLVGLLAASSGGAAAGFLNGISVATSGLVYPTVVAASSGPGSGGLFYASNTWGSFLSKFNAGTTAAGDPGFFNQKTFLSDSVAAKTVSLTPGSTDWSAFKADLYLSYIDLTI